MILNTSLARLSEFEASHNSLEELRGNRMIKKWEGISNSLCGPCLETGGVKGRMRAVLTLSDPIWRPVAT